MQVQHTLEDGERERERAGEKELFYLFDIGVFVWLWD